MSDDMHDEAKYWKERFAAITYQNGGEFNISKAEHAEDEREIERFHAFIDRLVERP